MAKTYSRVEFYELVWTKPISQLAKDFRLSDVAIHKICRKHGVPTPPPGWWAKKYAGKEAAQTPLPKPESGKSSSITISTPEICTELDALAEAREMARIAASTVTPDKSAPEHLIVEATIAALKAATPCHKGLVSASSCNVISCEVSPDSLPRLRTVLYRLIASSEVQGFTLEDGGQSARFVGHDETISISISETSRRVKHVATAKEKSAVAAWQRRSSNRANSWNWDDGDPYPQIPDWDYTCTGQLGIELSKVYMPGGRNPRSSWRDGKTQRLEELAPEIAIGMVVLATAQREAERLHKEAEDERKKARLEREKPYRIKHIAKRRGESLDLILDEMIKLEHFRQMVGTLRASVLGDAAKPRVAEFLRWSEEELQVREQRLTSLGLERRFEEASLFGDDDDHDFQAPFTTWL